jgi:predicted permease
VQIALSMALVTMTASFAQGLANAARVDLGFDVDSVVTFRVSPETSGYSVEAIARLFDRLDEELAALPGVTAAASAEVSLLSGYVRGAGAAVDGAEGRVRAMIQQHYTGPGFLRALDIALLAGRDFGDADVTGAPAVAIVNETFVERFGLGRDVIGRQITVRGTEAVIVGLAADTKYNAVTLDIEPQVFRPRRQGADVGSASFYVRSARPPDDIMNAIRETAARVDSIVPVTDMRTMRQQVRESLATERFAAATATAFAVLATVLAGLGLYGVLAYSVAQRSREIGLRFALGAPLHRIRGMVLRQTAVVALSGIALGVGGAWLLGRLARGLLFGVDAGDPMMLAAAAAVVAAVTLGGAYVPARRALRVDPSTVLRYE